MANVDLPMLNTPFFFDKRPTPIPGDLRPIWRIYVLLLLLRRCCRQNRSSFARLHVLSWAMLSPENRESLVALVNEEQDPETLIVRVEPSLNRAVDYAIGVGLIRRKDGDRFELTPSGVSAADQIYEQNDCLTVETSVMDELGKRVTEALVNELFR